MSLENSIKELTIAVNKLISILDKSNQNSNADLGPLSLAVINLAKMASDGITEPVIKMASEYILEPELEPTIKVVKQRPIPVFIPAPKPTADVLVDQPAVTLDVVEMRDAIRTMCSEMVQSDKKNKVGIEVIFAKYKATHLKMVDDTHIPSLYDSLTVFKGKLK